MPSLLRRSLLLTSVLLACAAAAAQAAESISITVGADPTEEVPLAIGATWSSADPSPSVYVTFKPAGGLACAASYGADDPNSDDVIWGAGGTVVGSTSENETFFEPGAFTLCGYLQDGTNVLAATGPVPLTVRSATASVALTVPARVDPGRVFQLSTVVTAELARNVRVTVKPAGGRGCEPNNAADDPLSDDVVDTTVQGTRTVVTNVTASRTRGTYLLCAYVQERSDAAPEAAASAQFLVAPDPCTAASRAVRRARRQVREAQAAVTRNHRTWERNLTAALRHSGATRRAYRALARQAHRRERRAARRRAAARAVLVERQTTAAQACSTPPPS